MNESSAWLAAEKSLTLRPSPEDARTSGLLSVRNRRWTSALLRLEEAARAGLHDFQLLDALGEAAYRAHMPEALLPYRERYLHPGIATHLARALLLLGEIAAARRVLRFAEESPLKAAITALLGIEKDIRNAIDSMLPFADRQPRLDFPEYWRALAPIADAASRPDLVRLAEKRSKGMAYDNPVIHYNQALRFLNQGELRAGWLLHEWRLVPGSPCPLPTAHSECAMWEGECLQGKSIVVIMDNGFGDQIFGLRYIPCLLQEGALVEVVASPELAALVRSSFPGIPVRLPGEPCTWRPDYWCYALSIPARAFIHAPVQTQDYLSADPALVQTYRDRVRAGNPKGLPVHGVVWHGDIRTPAMRSRAYSLGEFLAHSGILETPSLVVCLQKDVTTEELSELTQKAESAGGAVIDASPTLADFAHTAGWLMALDRMYSCDTSTAHLAGALHVPTTALIRNRSIWQWRCESPAGGRAAWYDSVEVKFALTPEFSYMFEIR